MNRILLVLILSFAAFLLFLTVCSSDDDDSDAVDDDNESFSDDDTENGESDDDDDISDDDDSIPDDDDDNLDLPPGWENTGKPFLQSYCTLCHTAPPAGGATESLETYEELRANVSAVYKRAVLLREMPLGDPAPTDKEVESFGLWLKLGAPE